MTVRRGYVRLTCPDPHMKMTVRLGPEPVKYVGGFSGWEVIERPGQTAMTVWKGGEPRLLQLGLMFDGYRWDNRVRENVNELWRCARGDDESPPGIIHLEGIPSQIDEWIIESLEVGDPIRDGEMYALRMPIVLQLREYVPPEFANLRRGALAPGRGKTKVIKAKRHDTPAKIAKRYHCKWYDLRDRNGRTLRKANQAIKAGTPIRIPVKQKPKKRKGGTRGNQRNRRDRDN